MSDQERTSLLNNSQPRYRRNNNSRMNAEAILWISVVAIFLGGITVSTSFFVVPPGMIGIVVTLGEIESFPPGLHQKYPWVSHLDFISAKTQLLTENNLTPTKEGLSVELDTAILFKLNSSQAGDLYANVGINYISTLIEPEAASALRGLTSESEAKALYSSGRNKIQQAVKEELESRLSDHGIIILDVLLKGIKLPRELTKSIEAKAKAEQDAARMEFVLQKERKEAERKAIEAGGIAKFQSIVSAGISPELLQWKGIEATEKFSESNHSKVIIMGNDGKSLPVILSADGN